MKKNKEKKEKQLKDEHILEQENDDVNDIIDNIETEASEVIENESVTSDNNETSDNTPSEEIIENSLDKKLEEKEKEAAEYLDMLRRTTADFDNFRKRTVKEKETIYDDGFVEGFKQLLPVLDNLERAISCNSEENGALRDGIEMVLKLFKDTMKKMNIEEIAAEGQTFNPDYHNAVMHIEDENYGENTIIEALQKGYKYKDKIIRYSMVKVAN